MTRTETTSDELDPVDALIEELFGERKCHIIGLSPMSDDEKLSADLRISTCSACNKPSVDIRFGYCPHCGARVVSE